MRITMRRMRLTSIASVTLCLIGAQCSPKSEDFTATPPVPVVHVDGQIVSILASLTDPVKLDSLKGERAGNPRLRKICYWLHEAADPAEAIKRAQMLNGSYGSPRGQETATAMLRNVDILERLGCFTEEGLAKLRRGNAPTIMKGPYAGELAEVDHIIPRSVCPELDNKLFNLEFMPETLNRRKSDKVGDRQRQLARKWHRLGLLSDDGLEAVEQ
jgi:hypothetical protein